MLTLPTTVPLAKSICEGTPRPTAAGAVPAAAIASRAVASMPAMTASLDSRAVGCSTWWRVRPPSRIAAAVFVPPTSMPSTAGCVGAAMTALCLSAATGRSLVDAVDCPADGSTPRSEEPAHRPHRGRRVGIRVRRRVRGGGRLLAVAEEVEETDGALPQPTEEIHLPDPSYLAPVMAFGITLMITGI